MTKEQNNFRPNPANKKVEEGICMATNHIMKDGMKIGYMYREEPEEDLDSGWRFLSGTEDDAYMDDDENSGIYDVETIIMLDPAIRRHLHLPFGTELERVEGSDQFVLISGN